MSRGQNGSLKIVASVFNRNEEEAEALKRAQSLSLDYFDIRNVELQPDVLSLVSVEEAKKGVLPIKKEGELLILGLTDPESDQAKKIKTELEKYFEIKPVLISWSAIKDALPHYQGLQKQKLQPKSDYEIEIAEEPLTFRDLEQQINSAPLQEILKYIMTAATSVNASDIHLEPQKEGARIRFRIDGVLHVIGALTKERFQYVLSQIELASGLKLNVNESQEGRIEIRGKEGNFSVRVETMPTLYGDDISLRLFNTQATMLSLVELGLSDYAKKILDNSLLRPSGMILVVGPTGAGKTSTIYAILNALNRPERKIVTLEDPIEYALPGITQSQIIEREGFADRLKAVLREDPDIVMIGEIRDSETADVALHAALTGHLMVSTFHANNAVTALGLLREMSTAKTLLAPAINLIISQRLVRRLCSNCREAYNPSESDLIFAQKIWNGLADELKKGLELKFYHSRGCDFCGNLGFKGRTGIFEMLPLNLELQKMLSRDDITTVELQEAARKSGMITMEEDGLIKVISGVTSISEIMRVVKE